MQFHVNALHKASHPNEVQTPVGIVVPLDGWHFTRSTLDSFPDPKLAHDRRGAHWTFDGDSHRICDKEASLRYYGKQMAMYLLSSVCAGLFPLKT